MSVPFFSDFTKRTKDYFKKDKYALGQVVEISSKCTDDIKLKTKVTTGENVKPKFTATMKRPNGREIEVTEDLKKGMSLKIKMPKFYKAFDLESDHSNRDVSVTAKYRPTANAFYNTKMKGYYNPDANGERVMRAKAEFAVGDDQLNLCVGGELTVEDRCKIDDPKGMDPKSTDYALGFLYTPTPDSQYSVIYTPDNQSNGMEYSFTCFRKLSSTYSMAAKADGKVDTKLTAYPPVVTLAGGWTMGSNYLQAFVNSHKEWGMAYKVKVSDGVNLNLGVSSFLNSDARMATQFGYKLQL